MRSEGVLVKNCAERTRFELVVRNDPYVGLANRWFQPLTHLSSHLCVGFVSEVIPLRDCKDTKNFRIATPREIFILLVFTKRMFSLLQLL